MDIQVHEWLSKDEYWRWICPHIRVFLDELAKRGSGIKAVGLANYRAPDAVIFVEQPLHEPTVKAVVDADPALKIERNGIGQLYAVCCREHPVTVRHSKQPG